MLVMAPLAQAHMYMIKPAPYGAPDKAPLLENGSNFPCKNVAYTGVPATEWTVGSNGSFELFGSAVHGGGSCQISVTTDKAPTKASKWKVIHSFEGGCPVPPSDGGNKKDGENSNAPFPFLIPPELLDGEYTMAWTWMNKVGNREAYMGCAPVKVSGSNSSDKAAYEGLPNMAIANIAGVGSGNCKSPPGHDYTFANPGKYVTRSNVVSTGPWAELCGGAPSGGAPASGGGNTAAPPAAPANPGTPAPANPAPANPGVPSQAPPAASAPAVSAPAGAVTSTTRTFVTVTAPAGPAPSSKKDAQTPPAAKPTTPASQAPVAAPPAAPSQAPAAPGTGAGAACSPDGSLVCSPDGKQFAICNWGKAVFQDVAAGTSCQNNKIVKRADYASKLQRVYV